MCWGNGILETRSRSNFETTFCRCKRIGWEHGTKEGVNNFAPLTLAHLDEMFCLFTFLDQATQVTLMRWGGVQRKVQILC